MFQDLNSSSMLMDSGCGLPLEASSNQFNPMQNSNLNSSKGAKTPQYGLASGSGSSIIRTGTQERKDYGLNLNLNA